MIDLEEHEHLYSIESSHPRALWVSLFIHIFKIVLHLSPALFLLNLFLGSVFFCCCYCNFTKNCFFRHYVFTGYIIKLVYYYILNY